MAKKQRSARVSLSNYKFLNLFVKMLIHVQTLKADKHDDCDHGDHVSSAGHPEQFLRIWR